MRTLIPLALLAVCGLPWVLAAQDAPATGPAEPRRAVAEKDDTVYGDFRLIKSLTEEQKRKLHAVWVDFRTRIATLEADRDGQSEALLTAEQKAELAQIREQADAQRKASASERRKEQKEAVEQLKAEIARLQAQLAATSQPAK